MVRTQKRPLPDERMNPKSALFIGVILTLIGVASLYIINIKTAFFASISIFLYACIYTPLKQKTPLSVFVGAFPGWDPKYVILISYEKPKENHARGIMGGSSYHNAGPTAGEAVSYTHLTLPTKRIV